MAVKMNIAQAKARLSELVARAEAGEEVIIARDGVAAVIVTPVASRVHRPRVLGRWARGGGLQNPAAAVEPLYTEVELAEMENDWPIPRDVVR